MIGPLLAGFQFLTRLPLPLATDLDDMARSTNLFVLVGLALGGLAGAFSWALWRFFPEATLLRGVLVTVALVILSGGLHLDGLADTFDGLLSGKDRERTLEIMKDSRVGAMGVIMLWAVLSLKAAALSRLGAVPAALALACGAGRTTLTTTLVCASYVTPGGLASVFAGGARRWGAVWSWCLLVLLTGVASPRWLVALAFGVLGALAVGLWCRRRLGGVTGDVLGALCELTETVCLVVMALLG